MTILYILAIASLYTAVGSVALNARKKAKKSLVGKNRRLLSAPEVRSFILRLGWPVFIAADAMYVTTHSRKS